MYKKDFLRKFSNIEASPDNPMKTVVNKRGQKLIKCTRHIATKTGHQIKDKLEDDGISISYTAVLKYRPFYVLQGSDREKQSCLCKFCLNLRLKFNEMMKRLNDKSKKIDSITKYFSNSCNCEPSETGFLKLSCIEGSCNSCSLNPVFVVDDFKDIQTPIKFHLYVQQYNAKTSKKGEKKTGKRTVRKEFVEVFQKFKQDFDKNLEKYLLHRFEIKNDQHHWKNILENPKCGTIFHQDFSENLSASPKFEPQDAHFSGKQTSLHCTVVHKDGQTRYAYHISSDKGHDFAFTESVSRDLLSYYKDECEESSIFRVKSDNASDQYCCLYVFGMYHQIAREIKKPVLLHFGINGHGRGLVDAMSGFGVKTPLRKAIVRDDYFPESEEDLKNFLDKVHAGDETKYFKVISSEEIQNRRNPERKEDIKLKIKGCRKTRMIAIFPDGTFKLKRHLCSCSECIHIRFNMLIQLINIIQLFFRNTDNLWNVFFLNAPFKIGTDTF
jgi:hypothetical protein